ncbi:MAG TPA: hypothetical protein VGP72_03690 [Planctomycetota bacterium]
MNVKKITARYFNLFERKRQENLDLGAGFAKLDPEFRKNYYAFTCLLYHETTRKVYCGTTNFSNDILHTFDPVTKTFESLNYSKWTDDRFDIKCHRSLSASKNGKIYGAPSCLHKENERLLAKGAKLFSYDPAAKTFESLGIPKAHDYIQTITLDDQRGLIHGFCYPVFEYFVYSLAERRVIYSQYMGSIPHLSTIDGDGGYWATWGDEHKLFRYDPSKNQVKFFDFGFAQPCRSIMYPRAGPIDVAINGGDGYLWIGTELGEIWRLEPKSAELRFMGKAVPTNRLPALCIGPEGLIFGAGGRDWDVRLICYDRSTNAFQDLGQIVDPATGRKCFRPHDCVAVGNTLYLGETDNPERGDWLWEVEIA